MAMVQHLLSSTFSKKYSSEVSWPILIKFHVNHHQVGGKAAHGFWAGCIRPLVAMIRYSSQD